MSSIEFGLLLPAQPGRGMTREIYLKRIREGLDIVSGHFHSIWYVDHVQFQDAPILEGWTALIYMAARYPSFHFGNVVLLLAAIQLRYAEAGLAAACVCLKELI